VNNTRSSRKKRTSGFVDLNSLADESAEHRVEPREPLPVELDVRLVVQVLQNFEELEHVVFGDSWSCDEK